MATKAFLPPLLLWALDTTGYAFVAYGCLNLTERYGYGLAVITATGLVRASVPLVSITLVLKYTSEKRIHERNSCEEPSFRLTVLIFRYFLPLVFLESILVQRLFLSDWLISKEVEDPLWLQYLYFIPKSLLFEVVFDFFHYWVHRTCHINKTLFKYVHADHHEHDKPGPLTTFYTSVPEYILAIMIPSYTALWLCKLQYTPFQLQVLLFVRLGQEIAGHSGLDGNHWRCFAQFPFIIPDIFSLRIRDHDLHHSRQMVNFSKRFLLWDIVFGTADSPEGMADKRFQRRLKMRVQIMGLMRPFSTIKITGEKPSRRETVLNPIGFDDLKEREETRNRRPALANRAASAMVLPAGALQSSCSDEKTKTM